MIGKTDPGTSVREMWLGEMPQLVTQEPQPDGREAWRGRTSAGAEVLARRVMVSEVGIASEYLERLRNLHQGQDSYLTALAGAAEDGDSIWLLFRPIAAAPLGDVIESGLDAAPGVALGIGIFHGLATLHRCELGHDVGPDSVLVDTMGLARIDGTWLPVDAHEAGSQVKAAGELLCRLLELPVRPGAALLPIESHSPALAAAVRSIAGGTIDDAASATALLAEAAGGLAAPAQLGRSNATLSERVRQVVSGRGTPPRPSQGRVQRQGPAQPPIASPPPIPAPPSLSRPALDSFPAAPPPTEVTPTGQSTPVRPPAPVPAPIVEPAAARAETAARSSGRTRPAKPIAIGPRPSRDSTWKAKPPPSQRHRLPGVALMVAALILVLVVVGVIGVMRLRSGPGQVALQPSTAPTAASSAAPPKPPAGPPASAGDVKKVELAFDQPERCNPGDRACQLHVQVDTNPLPNASNITWTFVVTDLCNGQSTKFPGNQVSAGPGWTYVWANNVIQLPAAKRQQITAQTSEPAVAASVPLVMGQNSC